MTQSADRPTIEIDEAGHTVATAEIHGSADTGVLHSDLHVESGHLPMGTRTRLVDAVLDSAEGDQADRLVATMPLSDTEMLDRVRERCDDVETRAAGSTKIVEARLTSSD
jgi:uncharacterized caspase-like protein